MIRFINCFRRRAEISPEEFRRYWNDPQFSVLVERVVKATGAKRAARNLSLQLPDINERLMKERGQEEPFDGVLEYYWDNARDLMAALGSPEGEKLLAEMWKFQEAFVDFPKSRAFFTEAN